VPAEELLQPDAPLDVAFGDVVRDQVCIRERFQNASIIEL